MTMSFTALTAAIIDIRIPLRAHAPIDLEGGFTLTRQLKTAYPELGVVLLAKAFLLHQVSAQP
jgi:hypothetical protein